MYVLMQRDILHVQEEEFSKHIVYKKCSDITMDYVEK